MNNNKYKTSTCFYLHMTIVFLDDYREMLCDKIPKMLQDAWLISLPFQQKEKNLKDQGCYLLSLLLLYDGNTTENQQP